MNIGSQFAIPPFDVEVEQALAPAPLEDRDDDAVRGSDGEQVEDDRLHRDHDRAERDEQEHEGEEQHERRRPAASSSGAPALKSSRVRGLRR